MAEKSPGLLKRFFRFGSKAPDAADPSDIEPVSSTTPTVADPVPAVPDESDVAGDVPLPDATDGVTLSDEANILSESTELEMEPAPSDNPDVSTLGLENPTDVSADPATVEPSDGGEGDDKAGWLARLRRGLSRSSGQLTGSITSVFTKRKLDEDALQDLEDLLIQADLGVETAMQITDALSAKRLGKDVSDEDVKTLVAEEVEAVLDPVAAELELDLDRTPHVILVVGVNGSGKTTTIGKLGQKRGKAGIIELLAQL
ncbi:MAG: signal recognition particle receptor subunit alpha, partial [Pseudomonadota bacterium]